MRLTQPLDPKKVNTSFHNDTIWLDACDTIGCEADIWTMQRLKISLVAHKASTSNSCMWRLHRAVRDAKKYVRTIFRYDKVVVFGRCRALYVVLRGLHQPTN